MRLRKDLAHAWIGYRQFQRQKDCPGCARSSGIMVTSRGIPCSHGGRSEGYRCRHCSVEFTLHFHQIWTAEWQANRFILGAGAGGGHACS